MQKFKGIEYVKIAIANAFGLDKELFEDRIKWVDDMIEDGLLTDKALLDKAVDNADEPALFTAGVIALQDALASVVSGFMAGLDACASGIQIMGALINCDVTCRSTGLIDPTVRADIYDDVTTVMNVKLNQAGLNVNLPRSDVKQALMTHFYGSKQKPEEIFGKDTIELETFYDSLNDVAVGAVCVMGMLLNAWQPYALSHSWTLPDGFEAYVPVMTEVDFKVEVDELDHATFTHRIYENQGTKEGLSIAANVVHSIDAMVVREMNRRCNYDYATLVTAQFDITAYLGDVLTDGLTPPNTSDFVSLRLAEQIVRGDVDMDDLDDGMLISLFTLISRTLEHKAFPIVCVHDEFKCHPNNMNHLRQTYIDIFVELSKSDLLEDILSQIHGTACQVQKFGDVSKQIAQSNYALS